jgi:hypothetical protein
MEEPKSAHKAVRRNARKRVGSVGSRLLQLLTRPATVPMRFMKLQRRAGSGAQTLHVLGGAKIVTWDWTGKVGRRNLPDDEVDNFPALNARGTKEGNHAQVDKCRQNEIAKRREGAPDGVSRMTFVCLCRF